MQNLPDVLDQRRVLQSQPIAYGGSPATPDLVESHPVVGRCRYCGSVVSAGRQPIQQSFENSCTRAHIPADRVADRLP